MPRLLPATLVAVLALTIQTACAQEPTKPTLESCAAAYGVCVDACRDRQQSDAAQAGCIARCAGRRASCEAESGYEKAKPWLREQFDKMEDFFEGFREGPEGEAPEGDPAYKDL